MVSSKQERIKKEMEKEMVIIHNNMVNKLLIFLRTGEKTFEIEDYTMSFQYYFFLLYRKVYALADDDNYSRYLFDYYDETLRNYTRYSTSSLTRIIGQ